MKSKQTTITKSKNHNSSDNRTTSKTIEDEKKHKMQQEQMNDK